MSVGHPMAGSLKPFRTGAFPPKRLGAERDAMGIARDRHKVSG